MLSTILLFLQSSADVAKYEWETKRGSIESNPSLFDAVFNPCCFVPLLIIVASTIAALLDRNRNSKISKFNFTRKQIIIAVACVATVISIGSFFLYQRNENLKKAEAERKAEVEAYFKKINDDAREKAKQSPEIICKNGWYSEDTCKRLRAMSVDEIIEVSNSFETKMMQFAVKNVPSVEEKCKRENIKPDACETLIKDERLKALEVIRAIQNTVPAGGKANLQNAGSQ